MTQEYSANHQPDCSLPLDFSMQAFEHLAGIRSRSSLVMEPETALVKLIPDNMSLNKFAGWVAENLIQQPESWLAFNLAGLYYRIEGNAPKAMQCCRLALHFSPRQTRTIALVNMGNILMNSQQQEDGIIVLHAAVDHSPTDPIAQYTLANAYALIGDLNRYFFVVVNFCLISMLF